MLFLIAVAMNCAVRMAKRFSPGSLLIMSGAVVIMLSFRAWVALVIGAALMGSIIWSRREVIAGIGAASATALVTAGLILVVGISYRGYSAAVDTDLQQADTVRRDLAVTANSGFDPDADVSTPKGALTYLPKGLVSIALGPFPWQLSGARQAIGLVDVAAWWLLLPALWRGQRAARRLIGRRVLLLLVPAIATAVMLSLSIGNFGTALRERTQFQIFLMPLIALGLTEGRRRETEGEGGGLPSAEPSQIRPAAAVGSVSEPATVRNVSAATDRSRGDAL